MDAMVPRRALGSASPRPSVRGGRCISVVIALATVVGSGFFSPAAAQAPQIDIDVQWRPVQVFKTGLFGFGLAYSVSTPHSAEEFADFFPREALGGRREACGYEMVEGMVLTLSEPVQWVEADAGSESESFTLDPPDMDALLRGTATEATASIVKARDLNAESQVVFDGEVVDSGTLYLYTDDTRNVRWTLVVQVDCFCSYRSREGDFVGTLRNADLREKPSSALVRGELIPMRVANENESWSTLKDAYRQD